MSIIPPNVELVGDIGSFALFRWGIDVWTLYIRHTGALEMHRGTAGETEFLSLETVATRFPKRHVSATIIGEELFIVWVESTTERIYLSKWQMGLRRYTQAPMLVVAGDSPSIRVFKDTNLILAYRSASGQHVYRVSRDGGLTWEGAVVIDAAQINELGIDVYPASENTAYWAEED